MYKYFLVLSVLFEVTSCTQETPLKILGQTKIVTQEKEGRMIADTIYHTIPAFSFINQKGETVTEKNTEGKIYVAEFFFTSCPSICPKMKAEMGKVFEKYKNEKDFLILSHSIDPARDSVAVLKKYADKIGIDSDKWFLLTGKKDSIYKIAEDYLAMVAEDENAPGGLIHDGNFILIDKKRRIRGYYDGTKDEGAEKLIKDIAKLLHE